MPFQAVTSCGQGLNSDKNIGLQANQECRVIFKWLHRNCQVPLDRTDYGLFYKSVHLHGQEHGQSSVDQDWQIQLRCTHLWISASLKEGIVYPGQASGDLDLQAN